jgi:hypothetical protein
MQVNKPIKFRFGIQSAAILFSAVVVCVLTASQAMALPFSSTGFVNPNYNDSWDSGAGTGTALFQIYIDEAGFSVNSLTLEFESDIFDVFSLGDFTMTNPTGWTTSLITKPNGYQFSMSSGSPAANSTNDPVELEVAYTLLDSMMYNNASYGGRVWDEGQAWAVAYTLENTINIAGIGKVTIDSSSGSTAPIPEPASILFFGLGLFGLAGTSRWMNKKHSNNAS